jgi:hypothetical protein
LNIEEMKGLLMLSRVGIIQFTKAPSYVLDDMVRFPAWIFILISVDINLLRAYPTDFGFPIFL